MAPSIGTLGRLVGCVLSPQRDCLRLTRSMSTHCSQRAVFIRFDSLPLHRPGSADSPVLPMYAGLVAIKILNRLVRELGSLPASRVARSGFDTGVSSSSGVVTASGGWEPPSAVLSAKFVAQLNWFMEVSCSTPLARVFLPLYVEETAETLTKGVSDGHWSFQPAQHR